MDHHIVVHIRGDCPGGARKGDVKRAPAITGTVQDAVGAAMSGAPVTLRDSTGRAVASAT